MDMQKVFDDDRVPVLPYKRPMGKAGFFRPYEYVFDKFYDCVICPENHILSYATTSKDGYREFKSKKYICEIWSMIFKLCKCRKTSQPRCHYITNYVVIKTKMYVEDSLDNDIICDFLAIKRLCRHNVS